MKYIKDGIISECKRIILNDMIVFNPSVADIAEAGWVEYVVQEPEPVVLSTAEYNELVRQRRQSEYTYRSDSMYMAHVKYAAQADAETDPDKKAALLTKSETMRLNWMAEIDIIDQENPYREDE